MNSVLVNSNCAQQQMFSPFPRVEDAFLSKISLKFCQNEQQIVGIFQHCQVTLPDRSANTWHERTNEQRQTFAVGIKQPISTEGIKKCATSTKSVFLAYICQHTHDDDARGLSAQNVALCTGEEQRIVRQLVSSLHQRRPHSAASANLVNNDRLVRDLHVSCILTTVVYRFRLQAKLNNHFHSSMMPAAGRLENNPFEIKSLQQSCCYCNLKRGIHFIDRASWLNTSD